MPSLAGTTEYFPHAVGRDLGGFQKTNKSAGLGVPSHLSPWDPESMTCRLALASQYLLAEFNFGLIRFWGLEHSSAEKVWTVGPPSWAHPLRQLTTFDFRGAHEAHVHWLIASAGSLGSNVCCAFGTCKSLSTPFHRELHNAPARNGDWWHPSGQTFRDTFFSPLANPFLSFSGGKSAIWWQRCGRNHPHPNTNKQTKQMGVENQPPPKKKEE